MEPGTVTCNVAEKFYMSIIVDDKAGFHHTEWLAIPNAVDFYRKKAGFIETLQQPDPEAT
ncbi:hypothetical protein D3C81_2054210 [compost metagenome]